MKLARDRSTFLARFSHELKTPLTSIRLLTESMSEDLPDSPIERLDLIAGTG
jgi:signal transduction histidine kinase